VARGARAAAFRGADTLEVGQQGDSSNVKGSAAKARRQLRSATLTEIFSISLRNLELGQLKTLLHVEATELKALPPREERGSTGSRPERLSYELSTRLVRICLYYDAAMMIANSIFETSISLADRILAKPESQQKRRRIAAVEDVFEILSREQSNTRLANYLTALYGSLQEFVREREGAYYALAEMVALMESKPSAATRVKMVETAASFAKKVDAACELVQSYLKLTDRQLARKI
jgi:hypothetical protein